jgi:hypothetical protein
LSFPEYQSPVVPHCNDGSGFSVQLSFCQSHPVEWYAQKEQAVVGKSFFVKRAFSCLVSTKH